MIYIVTKGCYSDYHVIAATTDYDTAVKIAKKFDGDYNFDSTNIEEFPDAEVMLKNVWRVYFKENGDVWRCDLSDDEYDYRMINRAVDMTYKCDYDLVIYVESDTQEGAIKIAAEKRAKYLAEKNGL